MKYVKKDGSFQKNSQEISDLTGGASEYMTRLQMVVHR